MSKIITVGGMKVLAMGTDKECDEHEQFMKKREAFVKKFFEEKGWDLKNPSIEQILEVRNQDGWKNPT